jgi:hypothetical protein
MTVLFEKSGIIYPLVSYVINHHKGLKMICVIVVQFQSGSGSLENLCPNHGFACQRAVNWALTCYIGQSINLFVCQIANKADLPFYYIHPGVRIALTILAILGVNFLGAQTNFDIFQQPIFSAGVHFHGHDRTGGQRTEQQAVWIGACIITNVKRFVSDEFVAASLNFNLYIGGTPGGYFHGNSPLFFDDSTVLTGI